MGNIIIPISIPSEVMLTLNTSEQELQSHVRTSFAVMLFKEGKTTLGKAIQISGLSRELFEGVLAKNRISISDLDYEQIQEDINKLKDI